MYSMDYVDKQVAAFIAAGMSKPDVIRRAAPLTVGWPYVFGAWGERCTPANRQKRKRDGHPTIVTACQVLNGSRTSCGGCKWNLPVRQFDCRGYTHWLLLQVDVKITGEGCTSQWNNDANWSIKGPISEMPKDKVCCVFKGTDKTKEHTGLYMGDGDTIYDCSSGVQQHSISNKAWKYYAIPKGLYDGVEPEPVPITRPIIKRGSKGPYVVECQTDLDKLGYDLGLCGVDGDFGRATESAVKAFQGDHQLKVDGIVGNGTWSALDKAIAQIDPDPVEKTYTVIISGLDLTQAEKIAANYPASSRIIEGSVAV